MDLNLQADLALRLLIAAVLGGLIGAEREIHAHPAGMRTHLLVAVGCALFTELSIYGFIGGPGGALVDPSRVAAQIVTGMGFIGAGAILKYGTSIRGLTTAASLWSTAAIGIAAGTGQWLLAVIATTIVLVSLWPLNRIAEALKGRNRQSLQVRVVVGRVEALGEIAKVLGDRHVAIETIHTKRREGIVELDLDLRLPVHAPMDGVVAAITAVPSVQLVSSGGGVE